MRADPEGQGSYSGTNVAPLLGTAAVAAASFAIVARAVAKRDTAKIDRNLRRRVAANRKKPARRAAEASAAVGKWWAYVPVSVAAASAVAGTARGQAPGVQRSRLFGALTIAGSAVIAAGLNETLDGALPQPPAPPGRDSRSHPVFPSGHAFGTSVVAITSAYVIVREGLGPPGLAWPLAMTLPFTASIARLMEDKHWVSDVAGGCLAGIALSSLCLAGYEASR